MVSKWIPPAHSDYHYKQSCQLLYFTVTCFVNRYSDLDNVMSTCIKSLAMRSAHYSDCVSTGMSYLCFSFLYI